MCWRPLQSRQWECIGSVAASLCRRGGNVVQNKKSFIYSVVVNACGSFLVDTVVARRLVSDTFQSRQEIPALGLTSYPVTSARGEFYAPTVIEGIQWLAEIFRVSKPGKRGILIKCCLWKTKERKFVKKFSFIGLHRVNFGSDSPSPRGRKLAPAGHHHQRHNLRDLLKPR